MAIPPVTHNSWIVTLATYGTAIIQIAFPFTLFHRITWRLALMLILGMREGIAVIMGLPFFSGIMASADPVVVSSGPWVTIQRWLVGVCRPTNKGSRRKIIDPEHQT